MFKELIFFTKMVITTKNYKLSKIKQLIDLNGDLVNFDLTFSVKASDGSNFEALVVTQEQIDSGEPLEYKKADGSISGSIVADKDLYQNYFLLLKSENPVECEVTIDVNNVPQEQVLQQKRKIQEQMLYNENIQKENEINQQMLEQQRLEHFDNNLNSISDSEKISSNSINWRLIFLVGLLLIGLYLAWSFYTKRLSPLPSTSDNKPSIISDNVVSLPQQPIVNSLSNSECDSFMKHIQPQHNVMPVLDGSQSVIDNSLLHKLNNLNVWNKLKT